MLTTDKPEFETLLATLCAGWDRPMTEARTAAYWMGLAKMALIDFGRVVEHCLGEKAPDKFPTVHVCWELARMLRPQRALGALAHATSDDMWLIRANLKLLNHFRTVNAATPWRYGSRDTPEPIMRARLQCLVEAKNTWALDMRECAESRDDPAYQQRLWGELIETAERRIEAMTANQLELVA